MCVNDDDPFKVVELAWQALAFRNLLASLKGQRWAKRDLNTYILLGMRFLSLTVGQGLAATGHKKCNSNR
jgi:hypothetical protein